MVCQMRDLEGFEATAVIRKLGSPVRDVPIIALTANAMEGDKERCLAAGMSDYLTKPLRATELREALARWIAVEAEGPR